MQVNTAHPSGNKIDSWLYAGPTPGTAETGGMDWRATVSPPPGTTFGAGSLEVVQLIIPDLSYTALNLLHLTSTYTWSQNGEEGLDDSYPYPLTVGSPNYYGGDLPGMPLDPYNALSAQVSDKFEDYLMYFAPGSVQPVPLAYFVWSTSGSATIPKAGGWAAFGAGSAGAITPSGTATGFLSSNSFPTWTQILIASEGTF